MRDVLFKAKRITDGEWVYGSYVYIFCEDKNGIVVGVEVGKHWIVEPNGKMTWIDEDTICQYTGLTDKDGKLIWENDVVKKEFYTDYDAFANSEEYIGVVKYEDCAWCVSYERNGHKCNSPIFMAMEFHDAEHFEVIGSIFDNPELMHE